jgi:hypothetical protein
VQQAVDLYTGQSVAIKRERACAAHISVTATFAARRTLSVAGALSTILCTSSKCACFCAVIDRTRQLYDPKVVVRELQVRPDSEQAWVWPHQGGTAQPFPAEAQHRQTPSATRTDQYWSLLTACAPPAA